MEPTEKTEEQKMQEMENQMVEFAKKRTPNLEILERYYGLLASIDQSKLTSHMSRRALMKQMVDEKMEQEDSIKQKSFNPEGGKEG